MRRARAEAARRRAEAERADEGLEGVEAEVAAKRKQAAGIHKQRALLERKVAKRRAEMEKKVCFRVLCALPVAGWPCAAWISRYRGMLFSHGFGADLPRLLGMRVSLSCG